MRPVTLNLSGVKDPAVVSALMVIQQASQDTLQNDTSSSGSAMATLVGAAANQIAYFTSAVTTAYASLTAFGRSVIGASSASGVLSLLAPIPNSDLANSSISLNGVSTSLGGSYNPSWTVLTPGNITITAPGGAGKQAGIAASITPSTTGEVLFTVRFDGAASSTSNVTWQISYGTGTAPITGAAITGTAAGTHSNPNGPISGTTQSITVIGLGSNLTVGTAYWFDIQAFESSGNATLANITALAQEK